MGSLTVYRYCFDQNRNSIGVEGGGGGEVGVKKVLLSGGAPVQANLQGWCSIYYVQKLTLSIRILWYTVGSNPRQPANLFTCRLMLDLIKMQQWCMHVNHDNNLKASRIWHWANDGDFKAEWQRTEIVFPGVKPYVKM